MFFSVKRFNLTAWSLSLFALVLAGPSFAQTYFGDQSTINTSYYYDVFTGGTTMVDARFTMPTGTSHPVTAVKVYGPTTGNTQSYVIGIQSDDATINHFPSGTYVISVNTSFSNSAAAWWTTPPMTPASYSLSPGQIYHLIIDGTAVTASNKEFQWTGHSDPNHQLFPLSQLLDPMANTLSYNGTWNVANFMPCFEILCSDGFTYGNSYSGSYLRYAKQNVWIGETFKVPNTMFVDKIGVYPYYPLTAPSDNLVGKLVDTTAGVTLAPVTISAASISTTPTWIDVNLASPVSMNSANIFRLDFTSPSSSAASYILQCPSALIGTSPQVDLTFGGVNSFAVTSLNGTTFTSDTTSDMPFRLSIYLTPTPTPTNTATLTPTNTPTNTVTNTSTNTPTNTPAGSTGYFGNQSAADSISAALLFSSSRFASLRFTARQSKAVTQIRLEGNGNGTVPNYKVGIQADDGTGKPNGIYLGFGTVNFPLGQAWKTVPISTANLTAGQVYHVVVQYNSGTIDGSNYYQIYGGTSPNHQLIPYDQYFDGNQEVLVSSDSGSTWTPQGGIPLVILECNDGTSFGNSFGNGYQAVYGVNEVSEYFKAGYAAQISKLGLYLSRTATLPAAPVSYILLDTVGPVTIDQGTFGTIASVPTSPTWMDANLSGTFTLNTSDLYQLIISSNGSNSSNYYFVNAPSEIGGSPYDGLTYDGTSSYYGGSSNSGASWFPMSSEDLAFRFTVLNPPPTFTPTNTPTNSMTNTPTQTPTYTSTNTPTNTPTATCAPGTFGLTTIGAKQLNDANSIDGTRYICYQDGVASSIAVYVVTASSNLHAAIYSNSAGAPQSILSGSVTITPPVVGWNTLTLNTPVSLTTGTTYWLMFNGDGGLKVAYNTGAAGDDRYVNPTGGIIAFPNPINATGSSNADFSVYVNYCATSGGVPTPTPTNTSTPISTPPCGVIATFGNTVGASGSNGDNILDGSRYVCPQDGVAYTFSVNLKQSPADFHMAVYDDNAGVPGDLLMDSVTILAPPTGWNNIPLTSPLNVSAGVTYWLMYNGDGGAFVFHTTGSTGDQRWANTGAFLPFPAAAPGGMNSSNALYAIVLNYCPLVPLDTPTNTSTNTATNTPTYTATNTPTNSPTNTATNTVTNTSTMTSTNTGTATATNSPTNSATNTVTNTSTNSATNTGTQTATQTGTNTATKTATNSATDTPTQSSTYTPTSSATNTSTGTSTNTVTNTATKTVTNTATNTPTQTATNSATNTATFTPTNSFTATNTSTNSATNTATQTATNTGTRTSTNTATNTSTNSATNTATNTATITSTNSATNTATNTATATATNTSTRTSTNTATNTATQSATNTATQTPTNTATNTGVNTATNTATQTATNTMSNTSTVTSTNTLTATGTNTSTRTPTATATDTFTSTSTRTPTDTATQTSTNTPLNTATSTSTRTSTNTPTNTATTTSTKTPTNTATITDTPTITGTPTPTGSMTSTPTPDVALYLDDNFFDPNVKPLGMDVRVDKVGQVKILVFNITGEEVKKIADQQMAVGNYRFSWDGRNRGGTMVGSALYFIVIQQPSGKMVRKVIVLK